MEITQMAGALNEAAGIASPSRRRKDCRKNRRTVIRADVSREVFFTDEGV